MLCLVLGILVRTGNAEHPTDIFDEKTMLTYKSSWRDEFGPRLSFSNHGIARVNFDTPTQIISIRIEVIEDYVNWVVISEIMIAT